MFDYVMNEVRTQDKDRFLLSLFAPAQHREALWALYAFNIEIAKTRYVVSETQIGQIRLQWWRDAVAEIYDGKTPREHQVVEPLAKVIEKYDLPQKLFNDLIYAREFDLEGVAPPNFEGFLKYCEYTNAPLLQLSLMILGEPYNDTSVVGISRHYGLVGTLRSVPYMLSEGFVLLPEDILAQNSLSPKKLIDFNKKEEIPHIIKSVFEVYKDFRYDSSGQNDCKFLKKTHQIAKMYEQQMKSVDYDVFDVRLHIKPKFMALRLWIGS